MPLGCLGRWLVAGGAVVAVSLGLTADARAQGFGQPGSGGPGFGPGQGLSPGVAPPKIGGKKAAPQKPDGAPETHAASGGESLIPEGSEPTLPANPRDVSPYVMRQLGTSAFLGDGAVGREGDVNRQFYGLYYQEDHGDYHIKAAFPVWYERTQPSRTDPSVVDRASLYGGLYYNRRSAEHSDDVVFPFFWNFVNHEKESRLTLVGPYVNHVHEKGSDDWLMPFYFTGKREYGGYTVAPPFLHYTETDATGGLSITGPAFCHWKGGSTCDARTAHEISLGIAPLYFFDQTELEKHETIPPLLHYYEYNDRDLSWTNVWGPYYRRHTQQLEMLHLMPIYWSLWGEDEQHITVFPLVHHGYKGDSWLHVNPLFLASHGEAGDDTFASLLYSRYRGRSELDMVTPLWWWYRDADAGIDTKLLAPFFYRKTSPREDSIALFPFYGKFERFGIGTTWWVTPFFEHRRDLLGWATNIHPLIYTGRRGFRQHTVIAPLFFDFAGRASRSTVAFPFYWRFSDRNYVAQLTGPVYYREDKRADGLDWQIHLVPFLSYGETPQGHWWNILFGMAGFSRDGAETTVRTFWLPIRTSTDPNKKKGGPRRLQRNPGKKKNSKGVGYQ